MYRQVDRGNGPAGSRPEVPEFPSYPSEFFEHLPDAARGVPRPSAPLLDREREITQLCRLLRAPDIRLLTITGPGGVGKTRLALEAASLAAPHFPDGVIAISLAPVRDPAHVIPAIARGIGVQLSGPRDAAMQLAAGLHEQRSLLLLDNCEQVIEAAPALARLLHNCPQLNVLATSRAPLRLDAEHLFHAPPLSAGSSPVSIEGALPGAVQLFIARARLVDPALTLDDRDLTAIQEICHRLDGLPLAIELAAARIGAVSPRDLLERMEPRLPLLVLGNRDLPERQQTMRSTIAWSYDLLSERDRQVFRWLSVFVGGFGLHAAEATIATIQTATGQPFMDNAGIIDSMESLIANSLVHKVQENGRAGRYAMLEVVREFGLEMLVAHDELTIAKRAHAAWYASIREWLDPNRFSPGERFIDHLWAIDAEHPNVRAALTRSAALGDAENVLKIAGNTAVFWHHRGLLGEGRAWLELGLATAHEASPESRGWGLAGLALIRWTQGDAAAAEPLLREALEIADTLGHLELRALSLHVLAITDFSLGDHEGARIAIESALKLWQELELPSDEGMALHVQSWLPLRAGETDRRAADLQRAHGIFESIGHPSGSAFALHRLGCLALENGNERYAFDCFARSISAWLSVDERWAIARSIVMAADLAARYGRLQEAGLLLGVIDARLRTSNANLAPSSQRIYEQVRATLASRFDTVEFHALLQTGSRLTAAEIETTIRSLQTRLFERALLTQRETEVLERIASGATDREIADALFVSPRTVHTHVSHILTKLDATSRRTAVKRGLELGLIRPV